MSDKKEPQMIRSILRRLTSSSKFYNLTLSYRLTRKIQELNPDFQDVFIIVLKDCRAHKRNDHWLNVKPYYDTGFYFFTGCPMEIPCSLAAKILLEVCENPNLAELKSGVELIITHDRGHFKFSKKPLILRYPSGEEFCCSKYSSSEALVQLYAFNKVREPIDAMAAALALQYIVAPSISLKRHMNIFFRNWKELVDAWWEKEHNIIYNFPLNKKSTAEIIRKAADLVEVLKKYLDPKAFQEIDTPFFIFFANQAVFW